MTRGTVFGDGPSSENRTVRIYLWPRKKFVGQKMFEEFNVACIEFGGHLPVKGNWLLLLCPVVITNYLVVHECHHTNPERDLAPW